MYPEYTIYRNTDINSSNPMKLVLMLYEGAINFLNKAAQFADTGDVKNKNIYTNKARDIIVELNNALNIDEGGELALGLRRIYLFMNRHLMQASWRNDPRGIQEVRQMLSSLLEGWQDAYLQNRGGTAEPPRQRMMGMHV